MRIVLLHLAALEAELSAPELEPSPTVAAAEPDLPQGGEAAAEPGSTPATAPAPAVLSRAAVACEVEFAVGLGRALARRGNEVHVIARDCVVPSALSPATVHEWRAFGAPATLERGRGAGRAPYNLHLALPGCDAPRDGEPDFATRLADALRPDVVIAPLRAGDLELGRALAERAGAALVVRMSPLPAPEPSADERARAFAAAAVLSVPSHAAERLLRRQCHTLALPGHAEVLVQGDGLDTAAIAPEPRGAAPSTATPPLEEGQRCVLYDGDADRDPLGAALFGAAQDVLVRRLDLALVLPSAGAIACAARARGAAGRTRIHVLDPRDSTMRAALVPLARAVVLDDDATARSARRFERCVARGVLPLVRAAGANAEALAWLGPHLPAELARAIALAADSAPEPRDLWRRLTVVLDHPELPYLGARLTALAARELDWSVRAHQLEKLLERVVPLHLRRLRTA